MSERKQSLVEVVGCGIFLTRKEHGHTLKMTQPKPASNASACNLFVSDAITWAGVAFTRMHGALGMPNTL